MKKRRRINEINMKPRSMQATHETDSTARHRTQLSSKKQNKTQTQAHTYNYRDI